MNASTTAWKAQAVQRESSDAQTKSAHPCQRVAQWLTIDALAQTALSTLDARKKLPRIVSMTAWKALAVQRESNAAQTKSARHSRPAAQWQITGALVLMVGSIPVARRIQTLTLPLMGMLLTIQK